MFRFTQFKWNYLAKTVVFLNNIEGMPGQLSEEDFINWVSIPGNNPLKNILLLEDSVIGKLEGVIFIWPELSIKRAVVEMKISRNTIDRFNIENFLTLESIFCDVYRKCDSIHIPVGEDFNFANQFRKIGFNHIRTYQEMELSISSFANIIVPDGYLFRDYIDGDEKKLTFVQNEAFKDSWGFCPNSVEQIYYKVNSNIYSSKGVTFLVKNNTIVGYVWAYLRDTKSGLLGVIGMIGVLPSYRNKSFGKIIVQKAVKFFFDQGIKNIRLEVDLENFQAVRLYSDLGFRNIRKIYWYEKLLT